MLVVTVFILAFVGVTLAGAAVPEVEFVGGEISASSDAIFSDKTDPIAGLAKQHRISLLQRSFAKRCPEVFDAVPAYPLPGKDAGPAAGAYRGGDKGICKPHAIVGQIIQIRSIDNRVACAAHSVGPVVIG